LSKDSSLLIRIKLFFIVNEVGLASIVVGVSEAVTVTVMSNLAFIGDMVPRFFIVD